MTVEGMESVSTLIADVREIVDNGLRKAYQDVNATTVYTYWRVGRRIVEQEQQGKRREGYGNHNLHVQQTLPAEFRMNSYNKHKNGKLLFGEVIQQMPGKTAV